MGLFAWSVHMIYPERVTASGIRMLERRVVTSLEPEASEAADELSSAFRALEALNGSGQMELSSLVELARVHAALTADGGMNVADVHDFVETIRTLVMEKTSPKAM